MACAFDAIVYNGRRMKACVIIEAAANAAAHDLAVVWTANGMTAFEGTTPPFIYGVQKIVSAADEANPDIVVTAFLTTGFTIRKTTAGAGATEVKWLVWFFLPRGIAG